MKLVTSGEGGAVLTNDAVMAKRVRSLRSHGIEKPDSLLEFEGVGLCPNRIGLELPNDRHLGWPRSQAVKTVGTNF